MAKRSWLEVASRQCQNCGLNYPCLSDYKKCPVCLQGTETAITVAPMPTKDAERLKRAAEFERFYANWDAQREKRGDPSPESLGAIEAKQQAKLLKGLEQALSMVEVDEGAK